MVGGAAVLLVAAIVANLLKGRSAYPVPLHRPAATACADHWVGSWEASASGVSQTQTLANQTVRMIVAPHLAGSVLRVHLTNRFGAAPVTVGTVTIGLRGAGAALVPGSERPVTFDGRPSVAIPAGADAVSDSVSLSVGAFRDLAISVYVPGTVSHPVEHLITRQTSYLSPRGSGDDTAQGGGSAFTQTTTGLVSAGWYLLDGVDVTVPGSTGAVVAFGDSLTDGYQATSGGREDLSTIDTDARYPDALERRLIAARIPLSVLNAGIGGNQLLHSTPSVFGWSGLMRFGADALGQPGVSDVIVLEGINDIAAGATASQLIVAYEQLIQAAHVAGVAIQLGTLLPTGRAPYPGYAAGVANATREHVNAWIRTQHFSDGIVDFDAAVRDPQDPSALNPAYDGGDHVHLDPAGYRALARAVNLALLARPDCVSAQP